MKKKLSIKDIAEQLNVSKTTVSFVLNGKGEEMGVSKAMQNKVLKHIQNVGYRPNRMAQGLRTGKSRTIGMLIEDISDLFFSSIARKIEEILAVKGYRIIYGSTENNTQVTKELIEVFRNHQVDGYIIAPPPGIDEDVKALREDNLPVVIFDRPLESFEVDYVMVDNFGGTCQAIEHFVENGYKNIAMVTLFSEQQQMKDREQGYLKSLEEAGLPPSVMKIKYHEGKEKIMSDIQFFLERNPKIDAVFFATNYIAENGLEAISKLEKSVPNELGVIVFDDHNFFNLFKPSVTAIAQPIGAICTEVVNLLFDQFKAKNDLKPKAVHIPTSLIIRKSSKP